MISDAIIQYIDTIKRIEHERQKDIDLYNHRHRHRQV